MLGKKERLKRRKDFLGKMEMVLKHQVGFIKQEIPERGSILTVRVKDYDMENNVIFNFPGNRSYPTKYKCSICQEKVVMSVTMKKLYERALLKGRKIPICCNRCIKKVIEIKKREKLTSGTDEKLKIDKFDIVLESKA